MKPTQVALAWLLRKPGVTAPIVGASEAAASGRGAWRADAEARRRRSSTFPRRACTSRIPVARSHLQPSRSTDFATAADFSGQSFVALQHRNFRLIWIGLLVSFTGSMMQNAALLWHVSLLVPPERKGLALGLVGLVRVVPIIVFSLISGVVADAWNRRRLMLVTQIAVGARGAASSRVLAFRG